MKSYTKPDIERPIEDIRAEIQRDYEALAVLVALPDTLSFDAAVAAAKKGMVPHDNYPFKEFQRQFADVVARHSGNDAAFTDAFEVVTAVWNYFPHDDLGKAPVEALRDDIAQGRDGGLDQMHQLIDDPDAFDEDVLVDIDDALQILSDVSETGLKQHLRAIGGTAKDAKAIVDILADPERDPNEALMYLFGTLGKKKPRKGALVATFENIQPVVRAISACENHTVSTMKNGHVTSRMFADIARTCAEHMDAEMERAERSGAVADAIELIDPLVVLDHFIDIHADIAQIAQDISAPAGLEEAAHHVLDWLMPDIHEIMGTPSEEMAARMLGVAQLIATTGDPDYVAEPHGALIRDASESFADDSEYEAEITRIAEKVLCQCGDPAQMMPIPGLEPDDCEKRLEKIAPCLGLRSPIDPNDLPIPSPFM